MSTILIFIFFFSVVLFLTYKIIQTRMQIKGIRSKTESFYHDFNSSLTILKLTSNCLKDHSTSFHNDVVALLNNLEDGIGQIEASFHHWNNN